GSHLLRDVRSITGQEVRRQADADSLLIIGGPPCQPFSKASYWVDPGEEHRYRQARDRGHPAERPAPPPIRPDSRRDLVSEFMRVVKQARAEGFLFENVPSILHPR